MLLKLDAVRQLSCVTSAQSLMDIEMRSIKTGNFRFLQQIPCLLE